MKRIFLLGVIVSAFAVQTFAQLASSKKNYVIETSGAASTLKIEGNIHVTLVVASNEPNVYVEGRESFVKNVNISIQDGLMVITANTSSKTEKDVVIIYAPKLSLLELNGDIQLKTVGTLNAENFKLGINGNCKLNMQHTGKMKISVDDDYELIEKKITRLKAS